MTLHDLLDEMYQGRTLVFGHRGASAYAPMNTIPAFELAAEQGAQGVELDVHRTKDGEVVVIHDATVDATTDGKGLVSQMTLKELRALDAGSWFGERFAGVRVPTLDEVFEAVGTKLHINVEIKSFMAETDGIEALVAQKIKQHGMRKYVIVSSFNPLSLIRFRDIMPDVALGYLYAADLPTWPLHTIHKLSYEATHPHYEMINEELLEIAQQKRYRVNVWTVNDPQKAVELRDAGVHGLITDCPDVILKAIG